MAPTTYLHLKPAHPDLQFDPLVVAEDRLDLEVDSHCANERRGEGIVGVAEKKRGFAHAAVADDQKLEHVVKVLVCRVLLGWLLLKPRVI